jgi:hypothetical protein
MKLDAKRFECNGIVSDSYSRIVPSVDAAALVFLPSLNVHAHHEEPQHHRSFRDKAGGLIVGRQIGCERI